LLVDVSLRDMNQLTLHGIVLLLSLFCLSIERVC
jgi:hypothetical protein